jgi:pyruvate-formate lyase-activating enzyme
LSNADDSIARPAGEHGRVARPKLYTINIGVTGRCNAACSYCHYYRAHNRKEVAYDISDELFDTYIDFVAHWMDTIPDHTTYRFSGGDPLVLGDRLFRLADRAYARTSVKPFVLTSGNALSEAWVQKAARSAISHVFVSIENPIRPDSGAPNPQKVVGAMRKLNSASLPIAPGVCVLPNNCFKHLHEICCWFYGELGRIPVISEINYSAYCPPTEAEWNDLSVNLERVVRDFHHKTPLNLFASVSPELAYGTTDPYIFHLGLENTFGMNRENVQKQLTTVADKLIAKNHTKLRCPQTRCNWWAYCASTLSYWQGDNNNPKEKKLADYCRFKRLVNDAYYRVLVDADHKPSMLGIDALKYFSACNA